MLFGYNIDSEDDFLKRKIILFLTLAFITSFVACKEKNDTLKINATPIDEYVIVVSNEPTEIEMESAEYIKDSIEEVCDKDILIIEETTDTYDHEIIVGDVDSSTLSKKAQMLDLGDFEYGILSDGEDIAVYGESFLCSAAAYSFSEILDDTDINITEIIDSPKPNKPKNAILLIGDGMGFGQIEYFESENNEFVSKRMPNKSEAITTNVDGKVTDSAAASTALSTGIKTTNGRVGRDADGNDLNLMTELASEHGVFSMVLSTDTYVGATPAGFTAHADDRSEYELIKESQLNGKTDVLICEIDTPNMLSSIENAFGLAGEKKFFMMYEEAYIDKFSHLNEIENVLYSMDRFNTVIERVMSYTMFNPNTAVIVTADHETGALYFDEQLGEYVFASKDHNHMNVPVFAYGYGTEIFNDTVVDNTDIAKFIRNIISE